MEVERLPPRLEQDVRECAEIYYEDHQWARQFLYQAKGITYANAEEEESRELDDEDRGRMFMVMTRFDSFAKKYAVHEFSAKEILYAVTMMLSFNDKERTKAIQESEEIIREAQENYPNPEGS